MIYERFWPWWFAEWRRVAREIWNLLRSGIGYWLFMIRLRFQGHTCGKQL